MKQNVNVKERELYPPAACLGPRKPPRLLPAVSAHQKETPKDPGFREDLQIENSIQALPKPANLGNEIVLMSLYLNI